MLFDKFKKDLDTYRNLKSKKSKIVFIWDYYKIYIISFTLILIFVVCSIINLINRKVVLMNVVLINSDSKIIDVNENIFIDELTKAGVDVDNKVVEINDYLSLGSDDELEDSETLQVLNSLFLVKELDIFVGFKDDFDRFIEGDAFIDLSSMIDENLLNNSNYDLYKYNDSLNNSIVGGIILNNSSLLHKAGYYHSDVILGVVNNSENIDNSLAFISQLLKD